MNTINSNTAITNKALAHFTVPGNNRSFAWAKYKNPEY